MRQSSPDLRYVQTLERSLAGDMGIAVEGSNATIPGDDMWHGNGANSLTLPAITPFTPKRWIEIASRGTRTFNWTISAEPFITLSQSSGTMRPTDADVRVYISVDWTKVVANFGKKSTMNFTSTTDFGTAGNNPQVMVQVNATSIPSNFTSGFVESAGQLAFEAEHFTRTSSPSNLSYMVLPKYGRTLSAVKLSSGLAENLTSSTAPVLEYDFFTFTPTTASKGLNLTLILSPSLNINPKLPLAYVAQIDEKPQVRRQYVIDRPQPDFPVNWGTAVANSAWTNTTNHGAVLPGKHTLKVWLVESNVILQKVVLDLGGVVASHNGPPESWMVGGGAGNGTIVQGGM
jgi:hypothetical protein